VLRHSHRRRWQDISEPERWRWLCLRSDVVAVQLFVETSRKPSPSQPDRHTVGLRPYEVQDKYIRLAYGNLIDAVTSTVQ
jgi:hypothetical protein